MTQFRFTPRSVLRFVKVLETLITQDSPRRITFNPLTLGMSTETGVARIRDSAHAFINGQVTHPTIDAKALAEKWPLYKVTSLASGEVVIVPKTEKQTNTKSVSDVLVGQPDNVLAVVKSEDVDAIRAFALLLSRRFLGGRVQVIGDIPYAFALGEEFDISFIEEKGNQYLI